MKKFALIIVFLMCFIVVNAQHIDSLKHVVVVTELQDSMALINNHDINIINKMFYEKEILDSLNTVNDSIIKDLNIVRIEQSDIILKQKVIIQNDSLIKLQYKEIILAKDRIIQKDQKDIKSQKIQKSIWMSTTGGLAIALLVILLI